MTKILKMILVPIINGNDEKRKGNIRRKRVILTIFFLSCGLFLLDFFVLLTPAFVKTETTVASIEVTTIATTKAITVATTVATTIATTVATTITTTVATTVESTVAATTVELSTLKIITVPVPPWCAAHATFTYYTTAFSSGCFKYLGAASFATQYQTCLNYGPDCALVRITDVNKDNLVIAFIRSNSATQLSVLTGGVNQVSGFVMLNPGWWWSQGRYWYFLFSYTNWAGGVVPGPAGSGSISAILNGQWVAVPNDPTPRTAVCECTS